MSANAAAAPRYWSITLLRITGCSDSQLWYANLVGQLVPYEADDGQYGYRSREPSGYVNFIRREDATPTRVRVHNIHRQRWPFNSRGAAAVIELRQKHCGAACAELGVCQGLQQCQQKRASATTPARPDLPAGQSRSHSALEAGVNIGVGFVVSLGLTAVVMPAFGHHVTLTENLGITSIFTVASLLRAYALRRLFNRLANRWAA